MRFLLYKLQIQHTFLCGNNYKRAPRISLWQSADLMLPSMTKVYTTHTCLNWKILCHTSPLAKPKISQIQHHTDAKTPRIFQERKCFNGVPSQEVKNRKWLKKRMKRSPRPRREWLDATNGQPANSRHSPTHSNTRRDLDIDGFYLISGSQLNKLKAALQSALEVRLVIIIQLDVIS